VVANRDDVEIDGEVRAIQAVLSALAPLDEVTRARVLNYARERFGLGGREHPPAPANDETVPLQAPTDTLVAPPRARDIRTLREEKQPKSAVEMAVLVAYYLSEVAPEAERASTIGTGALNKYFKQAGHPLPAQPRMTLFQAKNAGYLDGATRGEYSLNPVGHNLIAHGLPRPASGATRGSVSTRRGQGSARSKAARRSRAVASRKVTKTSSSKRSTRR